MIDTDIIRAGNFKRINGSPEGVVIGSVGDVAQRMDGGTGTSFYIKESGNQTNTGWVAAATGGGIGLTDGDKGDITVSSSGGTWTVDNDVVTFAKMQNISTARILGRNTASSGDIEELTAATTKTLLALVKADVGLGNVDNTADIDKPISDDTQDALDLKANDADVVHDTGDETIAGVKTFSSDPIIPDEAYGAGWNGSLEPPTKNAVYDQIETVSGAGVSDGDKGDITVSSSGTVWNIDANAVGTTEIANDAVTYAKMQDVSATSRFLGRITSGSGDPEELTAANAKTILALTSSDVGLGNVVNVATGYPIQISQRDALSPADATVYYIGNIISSTTANSLLNQTPIAKTGTIKRVRVHSHTNGTLASAQNSTFELIVRDTSAVIQSTTTLSSTIQHTAESVHWSNTGLNIAVTDGWTITIKWTTPTWTTNPTSIRQEFTFWVDL